MKAAVITVLILFFLSGISTIFLFNYYQVTWENLVNNGARVAVNYEGEFALAADKKLNLELCNTDLKIIEASEAGKLAQSGQVMKVEAVTYQWEKNAVSGMMPKAEEVNGELTFSTCEASNNVVMWDFGIDDWQREHQRNELTLVVPAGFEWAEAKVEGKVSENTAVGILQGENLRMESRTGMLDATGLKLTLPEVGGSLKLENRTGRLLLDKVKAEKVLIDNSTGRLDATEIRGSEIAIKNHTGSQYLEEVLVDKTLTVDNQTGDLEMMKLTGGKEAVTVINNHVGAVTIGAKEFIGTVSEVGASLEVRNSTGGVNLNNVKVAKMILLNKTGEIEANDCEAMWETSNKTGSIMVRGGMFLPGSQVLEENIGSIKTDGVKGELVRKVGGDSGNGSDDSLIEVGGSGSGGSDDGERDEKNSSGSAVKSGSSGSSGRSQVKKFEQMMEVE